jgi:beta-glucosidase
VTKFVKATSAVLMLGSALCSAAVLSAPAKKSAPGVAHPALWPALQNPVAKDEAIEARIRDLLGKMSLEQKVGQVIQADVGSIKPEDVTTYHLGSILNGGNSAPGGKQYATAPEWLAGADQFYDASMVKQGNLPQIPITWGSDAVHGHNNVIGAVLFPHNIGLGAMRNPELMRKIGSVTAAEMRITGLDWTFGPTLAVVRDDRWGRTYESYSENPGIVASYAGSLVEGLQGKVGSQDWLRGPHIVSTAKHFVGDGGTTNGKDQGDNAASETALRDIQAAGYKPALNAGVQSVMASYSSWQGVKMHGNRSLLTDVLKGRMQFGGFVVGDWNGHGQVPGCKPTDCAASMNAGLDMYMAPDSWKDLYVNTLAEAKDGRLSMARLDDAVSRILRVKLRAGLFESGRPSTRFLAGKYEQLGSAEHRAVARQAVSESLVLLKNEGDTLPFKAGSNILVTGDGADSYMKQSGGWTLTWQGTGLKREDFPGATTIGTAIVDQAKMSGGSASISADGSFAAKPDIAVVVFGEDPYAEFQGDVPDLMFRDRADNLALLKSYKAQGIKTVAVFLSGRPLWVNPHINASDSFVAAWLPGSEGTGVSDVLFGKSDFKGKLSFSWPKNATQFKNNVGDKGYTPLFAFGYGLSYAKPAKVSELSEISGLAAGADLPVGSWFTRGRMPAAFSFAPNGDVAVTAIDRSAQEDSKRFVWSGKGGVDIKATTPIDISRESNGALAVEIDMKVQTIGDAPAMLSMNGVGVDIAPVLRANAGKGWQTVSIALSCFAGKGVDMSKVTVPFGIASDKPLDLSVSRIALGSVGTGLIACPK